MAVPKYHEFYAPFLKGLQDGKVHTMKEMKQRIVGDYTRKQLDALTP